MSGERGPVRLISLKLGYRQVLTIRKESSASNASQAAEKIHHSERHAIGRVDDGGHQRRGRRESAIRRNTCGRAGRDFWERDWSAH